MNLNSLKNFIIGLALSLGVTTAYGQIGIGTDNPNGSSILDVTATDKGVLIPRVANLGGIASPATGLLVYLTTDNRFYFYDGSVWKVLNPWDYQGVGTNLLTAPNNTGVGEPNPGSKLSVNGNLALGSSYAAYQGDGGANPFPPANGALIEGNVGIGTTAPSEKLEVVGNIEASGTVSATTVNATAVNATIVNATNGNGIVPKGGIIMWSGTTIPAGWALCNGQTMDGYRTPDLRGRFIAGYDPGNGAYNNPGNLSQRGTGTADVGGAETVALTVAQMPEHNHSMGSAGDHSHTIDSFKKDGLDHDASGSGGQQYWRSNGGGSSSTESNGSHTHTINNEGGNQAHENRPPYYVLAFIMRVQ